MTDTPPTMPAMADMLVRRWMRPLRARGRTAAALLIEGSRVVLCRGRSSRLTRSGACGALLAAIIVLPCLLWRARFRSGAHRAADTAKLVSGDFAVVITAISAVRQGEVDPLNELAFADGVGGASSRRWCKGSDSRQFLPRAHDAPGRAFIGSRGGDCSPAAVLDSAAVVCRNVLPERFPGPGGRTIVDPARRVGRSAGDDLTAGRGPRRAARRSRDSICHGFGSTRLRDDVAGRRRKRSLSVYVQERPRGITFI